MKDGFLFKYEWIEMISELPSEEQAEVYRAVCEYAKDKTIPNQLKPIAFFAFKIVKREIDENQKVYEQKRLKLKENGKFGGRPRKQKKQTKPIAFEEKEKTKEKESFSPRTPLYKEKENKKEKENLEEVVVNAQAREEKPFDELIRELNGDAMWKDAVCMTERLDPKEVPRLLEAFTSHLISVGEQKTIQNSADAQRRFKYWVYYYKKRQKDEINRTDRFSERRGTEPGANGPEIYPRTL